MKNLNNNYINKIEDDIKKKKITDRLEKKLILQKQRQKEKERYTEYNQKLNENEIEKSASKQKLNNHHYNKIKNIENIKILQKRPASSSRIISSHREKKNNNNYSSMNEKKIGKISSKVANIINYKDKSKNNNVCILMYETERNIKKKDV